MSKIKSVLLDKKLVDLKKDTINAVMEILIASVPSDESDKCDPEIWANWMHNILIQIIVEYTLNLVPVDIQEKFLQDFNTCCKETVEQYRKIKNE